MNSEVYYLNLHIQSNLHIATVLSLDVLGPGRVSQVKSTCTIFFAESCRSLQMLYLYGKAERC